MSKRRKSWIGVWALSIFGIGLTIFFIFFGKHTVSLSEDFVQKKIDEHLIEKDFFVKGKARLALEKVNITSATILISDTVTLVTEVEGTLVTGKEFTLTTYAVGVPTYEQFKFFFKPVEIKVVEFTYQGKTPSDMFRKLSEKIPHEKIRGFVNDNALEAEEWVTEVAENATMHTLQKRAVYELKNNVKGVLIKASVDSIEIKDKHILITVSVWRLAWNVTLGILCVLGAMVMTWHLLTHGSKGEIALFAVSELIS